MLYFPHPRDGGVSSYTQTETLSTSASMLRRGWVSFRQTLFRFVMSSQILHFPFTFLIITTLANYSRYWISHMCFPSKTSLFLPSTPLASPPQIISAFEQQFFLLDQRIGGDMGSLDRCLLYR